jgi:hypothetical protein
MLLQRIHKPLTFALRDRRSITAVMKEFLDRQINRLWMWLVTPRRESSVRYRFAPGDEERLIQALISMNAVLARAVR